MTMSLLSSYRTHCSISTRSPSKSSFFRRKRFSVNQAHRPCFSLQTWACRPIRIIYIIRPPISPWPCLNALSRDSSCPSWLCLCPQLRHWQVTRLSKGKTWKKWGDWPIARTASWKSCLPTSIEGLDPYASRSEGWATALRNVEFSLRKRISIS